MKVIKLFNKLGTIFVSKNLKAIYSTVAHEYKPIKMSRVDYTTYDFPNIEGLSPKQLEQLRAFFVRVSKEDHTTWVDPVKQIESIFHMAGVMLGRPTKREETAADVRIPLQEKCLAKLFNLSNKQIKLIEALRNLPHAYQQFLNIIPGYVHPPEEYVNTRIQLIKKGIIELEKDPHILLETLKVKEMKGFLSKKELSTKGRRKIEFIERIIKNVSEKEIFELSMASRKFPLTKELPPYDEILTTIYGGDFELAYTIYHHERHRFSVMRRYMDYKQRDKKGEYRYKWIGADDERTCEICKEIRTIIDAEGKGKGVPLERAFEIMREVANNRIGFSLDWSPHFLCRCSLMRIV